jgi:ABC-type sugar transport system substrate-binding protein
MRRSFLMFGAAQACLVLLASGCGGYDPFGPPSRVKRSPTTDQSTRTKPNFLIYVVPALVSGDVEIWALRAQHEANLKQAIFRIMGPKPNETAADQPEVVRRAVADGATALLVYPGDSPGLPKALAEAEAKGVPVVLLDKGLAAPEGSKPFTVVDYGPFDETAKRIVAATIEDLQKAKQPVDGTAILLSDKLVDGTSARRVAALKAAAEAAKFRQVVTVSIDGASPDLAKVAVMDAVKANPDVSVVLADDGEGLMAAAKARAEFGGKPIFFVGGYTDYRTSQVFTPPTQESCHVEGRFTELGAVAVNTALAKLRGESVGEHAYVPPKFTKTEPAGASPKNLAPTVNSPLTNDVLKRREPPKDGTGKPQ